MRKGISRDTSKKGIFVEYDTFNKLCFLLFRIGRGEKDKKGCDA